MSAARREDARSRARLAALVALCLGVGALGGIFTSSSVSTWYRALARPSFTPPGWIFGPVWTALYVLMAVAAWLVWRAAGTARRARGPLALFGAQLALNLGWSAVFFGLRRPDLAALEIVVLWAAILATLLAFGRRSRLAAALLAPYLAWVTFAAALNLAIWRLNA